MITKKFINELLKNNTVKGRIKEVLVNNYIFIISNHYSYNTYFFQNTELKNQRYFYNHHNRKKFINDIQVYL